MLYMLTNRKYIKKQKMEKVKECEMGGIFRQLLGLVCALSALQEISGSVYSFLIALTAREPKHPLEPKRNARDF